MQRWAARIDGCPIAGPFPAIDGTHPGGVGRGATRSYQPAIELARNQSESNEHQRDADDRTHERAGERVADERQRRCERRGSVRSGERGGATRTKPRATSRIAIRMPNRGLLARLSNSPRNPPFLAPSTRTRAVACRRNATSATSRRGSFSTALDGCRRAILTGSHHEPRLRSTPIWR